MPERKSTKRANELQKEGKSASMQAGDFVREEIDAIREGEHGARSAKQAIAIGLSKARRAGVKLPIPKKGTVSEETREKAIRDSEKGAKEPNAKPSPTRSKAIIKALKKEGNAAASHLALSRHAKSVAKNKTAEERSEIAKKAARTRKRNES